MDKNKIDRLDILLQGKQITIEIYKLLQEVKNEIAKWDEDKKWRFLTHAAVALKRIIDKQIADSLDQKIVSEIKQNQFFEQAEITYAKWFSRFSMPIPEAEKWYLFIHILNYLEEKTWK